MRRLLLPTIGLLLAACASTPPPTDKPIEPVPADQPLVVSYEAPEDPLAGFNRAAVSYTHLTLPTIYSV